MRSDLAVRELSRHLAIPRELGHSCYAYLRIAARCLDRRAVAELARARARSLSEASTQLDRSKVEALYDPALLPPNKPLLSTLLPGPSGEDWVRVFSFDAHAAPRGLVVSADGRVIA